MGLTYNVDFVNQSANIGTVCLYQTLDNASFLGPAFPLAWLTRSSTAPYTMVSFKWTTDYGFTWANTGSLQPGVLFVPAQYVPANLVTTNQMTFTNQDGSLQLVNQTYGPVSGALFIREDGTIPPGASIGFGMSDQPTFAVQAQPNITVQFEPTARYWIIFGTFQQGEALNPHVLNAGQESVRMSGSYTQPAEIVFPPDVFAMTATLNYDNSWTITPGWTLRGAE